MLAGLFCWLVYGRARRRGAGLRLLSSVCVALVWLLVALARCDGAPRFLGSDFRAPCWGFVFAPFSFVGGAGRGACALALSVLLGRADGLRRVCRLLSRWAALRVAVRRGCALAAP